MRSIITFVWHQLYHLHVIIVIIIVVVVVVDLICIYHKSSGVCLAPKSQ